MSTKKTNTEAKKRIAIIGKFSKMHDEEYIAEGFENLGHAVIRIEQSMEPNLIRRQIVLGKPDILLFAKYMMPPPVKDAVERGREWGLKTVCWLFDLYFNYHREHRLKNDNYFKADYVFTTDGGNQKRFEELGINHKCVRQGIRSKECFIEEGKAEGVVFVGSDNPTYPYRQKMLGELFLYLKNFKWYGRGDTDEVRGTDLNRLFGKTKVVVGDSVYSPYYWSNRVVETLGRGGFLIHPEVEGIKEEYPYLVTYQKDNIQDLKNRIIYYCNHEFERLELVKKNWQWVRDNYTIEKKCQEILDHVQ